MTRRTEEPDYPPAELAAWREGRAQGRAEAFWLGWWLGSVAVVAGAAVVIGLVLWPHAALTFAISLALGVAIGFVLAGFRRRTPRP